MSLTRAEALQRIKDLKPEHRQSLQKGFEIFESTPVTSFSSDFLLGTVGAWLPPVDIYHEAEKNPDKEYMDDDVKMRVYRALNILVRSWRVHPIEIFRLIAEE
jgi:hypothetical protein